MIVISHNLNIFAQINEHIQYLIQNYSRYIQHFNIKIHSKQINELSPTRQKFKWELACSEGQQHSRPKGPWSICNMASFRYESHVRACAGVHGKYQPQAGQNGCSERVLCLRENSQLRYRQHCHNIPYQDLKAHAALLAKKNLRLTSYQSSKGTVCFTSIESVCPKKATAILTRMVLPWVSYLVFFTPTSANPLGINLHAAGVQWNSSKAYFVDPPCNADYAD